MGLLVNGQWQDQWYDTTTSGGKFIREDSQFRDFISKSILYLNQNLIGITSISAMHVHGPIAH